MAWRGEVITGGYQLLAECDSTAHSSVSPELMAAETRRECMAGLRARGWKVYSSGQVVCRDCVASGRDVSKPSKE